MKILLDFRKYDGVVGGVEQGVFHITEHEIETGHSVVLLCKSHRRREAEELFQDFENLKILDLDVPNHLISPLNTRLDATVIQEIARDEKADIIHFPYNWSFPRNKAVPTVLTVHDVIPFTFREAQGWFNNRFYYKPGIKRAVAMNDVVVTVSEFSRKDLAEKTGADLNRIRVIYNGLRDPEPDDPALRAELKKRLDLEKGFVLNVGGIHERKNIVRLIRSFAEFVASAGYPGRLLITGKASGAPYQEKMKALCDREVTARNMNDRVLFTGFITDQELDALYRMTDLLIYPSLYEGFGIPVLEAMKLGVPVITSRTSALPEVAGDCAVLVDPLSVTDMATAMAELWKDEALRQKYVECGPARSADFTWSRCGDAYLDLFRELCQ